MLRKDTFWHALLALTRSASILLPCKPSRTYRDCAVHRVAMLLPLSACACALLAAASTSSVDPTRTPDEAASGMPPTTLNTVTHWCVRCNDCTVLLLCL